MPNLIPVQWDTSPTDFATLTNLHSLADGNIWQSGEINDSNPANELLAISYELVFNATPVAGDHLNFYVAYGDQAASNEIWDGGIGTSESEISTAASIAAVQQSVPVARCHMWQTNHGTTFKGSFVVPLNGPSWQLLIEAVGEALAASGNLLRYRYGSREVQ